MAKVQHKIFCDREFIKTESATAVQSAFRLRFNIQPPTRKSTCRWNHQFEEIDCLFKGKSSFNSSFWISLYFGFWLNKILYDYLLRHVCLFVRLSFHPSNQPRGRTQFPLDWFEWHLIYIFDLYFWFIFLIYIFDLYFWFIYLFIFLIYISDLYFWFIFLIYIFDLYFWFIFLIYIFDLYFWFIFLIYIFDLYFLFIFLIYIFDLYFWFIFLIYIFDLQFWFTFLIYIFDLQFWFTFLIYIFDSHFWFIFLIYIFDLYFWFIFLIYIFYLYFWFIFFIYRIFIEKSQVALKSDKNNRNLKWRPTDIRLRSYLAQLFLEREMLHTTAGEKMKIYFTFDKFIFRKSCRVWNNGKFFRKTGRPQMAVWSMSIACWINKATNTHSEYVILVCILPFGWSPIIRNSYADVSELSVPSIEQIVSKRRDINFRLRGITENKEYSIQHKRIFWNQE